MKLLSTTKIEPIDGSMDETVSKIYVYQLEHEDEYWDFENSDHEERCEMFNVVDQFDDEVFPGEMYKTYDFYTGVNYVIMVENIQWNV